MGYIVWYVMETYDDIINLEKFDELGMGSNGRDIIWSTYLERVWDSLFYLLFGAPLIDVSGTDNNPHNSFILLHSNHGIFLLVFFFYILLRSLHHYAKRSLLLFVITLCLIIRGMTDIFIFETYGMPVMLYLSFYPYAFAQHKHGAALC